MLKRLLLMIVAVASVAVLPTAAPANASATGCTSAPGGLGAYHCGSAYGFDRLVLSGRSSYFSGLSPTNVCYPYARFKYKVAGNSWYTNTYQTANTCGWGKGWIDVAFGSWMANNSSFCTSQINSANSNWPSLACVSIYD